MQAQAFRLVVSDPRRRGAPRGNVEVQATTAAGEQPAGDNVRGADAGDCGQEYSYQAQATDEDGDPFILGAPRG